MTSNSTVPYYAVIFTSKLTDDTQGYDDMANRMEELANEQEGFLGIDSARSSLGISVSYWKDLDSIRAWKFNSEHAAARKMGTDTWYEKFSVRIAKVEREYSF